MKNASPWVVIYKSQHRMYCKAISHLMLSINVPEALVGLELAADAVPPVEGEVVRAGAAVEIHYPHSGSAKLRGIEID